MGTMGATVISLAGVVCMIASLNGFILITGYLGQAAATRGIFPSALAAMTGPMRTPRHALMAAAVISSLVVLLSAGESLLHEFAFVCGLATSAMLVPYIMSCVAEPFHLWRLKTTPAIRMVGITLFNLLTVLYIGWGVISARGLFAPWVLAVVLCGVMLLGMRRLSRKKGVGKA